MFHGATINAMKDGARLTSDAFLAHCTAADGNNYTNVHTAVVPTQKVRTAIQLNIPRSQVLSFNLLTFEL